MAEHFGAVGRKKSALDTVIQAGHCIVAMATTNLRVPALTSIEDLPSTTFSGRRFTRAQLSQVVDTVNDFPRLARHELAETVCEHLNWRTPRGRNKTGCALRLLEALESYGLCTLPKRRDAAAPSKAAIDLSLAEKQPEGLNATCETSLNSVLPIELVQVRSSSDHAIFTATIEKHHYLGDAQPIGNYIEYFIVSQRTGQRMGCLRYACSGAWQLPARDLWIGWDKKQRERSRHRVLTQQRFLLLPWVNVQNLASHVLALSEQYIASDWLRNYGYQPVLLETFVDSTFDGACYKAANWELVGQTRRRSQDRGAPKSIFVRPLSSDFRRALKVGLARRDVAKRDSNDATLLRSAQHVDPEFVALWKRVLHLLDEVAATYDARWQKRQRVLDTKLLTLFIFRLITAKNRQGYGTTSDELWANIAAIEERRQARPSPSPAAWCQGRKKLDEGVFKDLNNKIVETHATHRDAEYLWFGRRVFAVDGSKVNLPPKLLEAGYPKAGGSSHYAQGLLSCLYDLKSKLPMDFDFVAHGDERRCAKEHLGGLKPDDVVVYDRGYFSYAMLQDHVDAHVHAVFRLQDSCTPAVKEFIASGDTDTTITVFPSKTTLSDIAKARPELTITPQRLRLVKYVVDGSSYCLGTTMLDHPSAISTRDLSDLYHARWGVEELYKVSKRTMCIEEFHSEYERGIKQELFAHLVLITMNRFFSNEAERKLNDNHNDQTSTHNRPSQAGSRRQTNFKNCIHVVGRNIEALLLDSHCATQASASTYALIPRRYQATRPGRSYQRRSMRPTVKWCPSGRKGSTAKTKVADIVNNNPCDSHPPKSTSLPSSTQA